MNLTQFTFALLLALVLQSCRSQQLPGTNDIEVTWELISNKTYDEPIARARFIITNNSEFTFTHSNWALYYNQTPRAIIYDNTEGELAKVEHISGDWYRLVPKSGFILAPGQTQTITYEAQYWWIKEADAPGGLYVVVTNPDGGEQIVQVKNYTILPFERPEQVARHNLEQIPFPSPQTWFEQNQSLNLHQVSIDKILPLIPSPKRVEEISNGFKITDKTKIHYNHNELAFLATYLQEQINDLVGLKLELSTASSLSSNSVIIRYDADIDLGPEAYELYVWQNGVEIVASDKRGLFYGVQSLLALLPPYKQPNGFETVIVPGFKIIDEPRFAYRGIHVDVARNFMPKSTIKKVIDIMAFYKLNKLHLHLTDDEGWRLEIAGLPELTAVGGRRGHTSKESAALHPSYWSGPLSDKSNGGSGFYTRKDFLEILRYANLRHIEVIPEINMPGHCRAAIKAMEARYEHFMRQDNPQKANQYRLIDPNDESIYLSAQFYSDNVANVALESVYAFFEKVVDEVIDMYAEANHPLKIIHVGGDEVPKGAWTNSPVIDKLMTQRQDIRYYENMHVYFTERILKILDSKGLLMAGWEEIALHMDNGHRVNEKFANGNVIPYVWNNLWGAQDLAYRLANIGYPVVMCHVTNFYFDLAYSNHPKEPGLYWGGFVNSRSPWHYNPYNLFLSTLTDNMGRSIDIEKEYKGMVRLDSSAKKNIKGLQAQLWSETILNADMLEYYLLPKMIAFAETAWAQPRAWESMENKTTRQQTVDMSWNIFANTLAQKELPRLSNLFGGFNYRVPPPGAKIENGFLFANVEYPGLQIRYTTDGSNPTSNSKLFKDKIEVREKVIKLAAFDKTGKSSMVVEL